MTCAVVSYLLGYPALLLPSDLVCARSTYFFTVTTWDTVEDGVSQSVFYVMSVTERRVVK